MAEYLNDPDADLEEAHARDGLIYELSVALMRLDGNDGDPHQLLWEGGPIPEPWGDAWQRYESDAERVLDTIGEGSARALVDLRSTLTNVQRVLEAAGHDAKGDDAACKALRLIAALGVTDPAASIGKSQSNGRS